MNEKNLHNKLNNESDPIPSIDRAWEGMKIILDKEMPIIHPNVTGYKLIGKILTWISYTIITIVISVLLYPKFQEKRAFNHNYFYIHDHSNNFKLSNHLINSLRPDDTINVNSKYSDLKKSNDKIVRFLNNNNTTINKNLFDQSGSGVEEFILNKRIFKQLNNKNDGFKGKINSALNILDSGGNKKFTKKNHTKSQANLNDQLNMNGRVASARFKNKLKNIPNIIIAKSPKKGNEKIGDKEAFQNKTNNKNNFFIAKQLNAKAAIPIFFEINKKNLSFQNTKKTNVPELSVGIQERIDPINSTNYFKSYTGNNSLNRLIPSVFISYSKGKSTISIEGTFFYNTSLALNYFNRDSTGTIGGNPDSMTLHISKTLNKVFGSAFGIAYKYNVVNKLYALGGIQLFIVSKGLTTEVKTRNSGAFLLYDKTYSTPQQDFEKKMQISLQAGIEYHLRKFVLGSRIFLPISNFNINKTNSKLPFSIELIAGFSLFDKKL